MMEKLKSFDHSKTGISVAQIVTFNETQKQKEKIFSKIKTILSLIDFLKKYLPVDSAKKYTKQEIEDVYVFMKFYQKLGGEFMRTKRGIEIHDIYELSLRSIVNEEIALEIYGLSEESVDRQKCVIGGVYTIHPREHIVANLTSAALSAKTANSIGVDVKTGFDKPGYTRNPKTKMKIGNKISKQNKRRR